MPWQALILLQNLFSAFNTLVLRAVAKKVKNAHFQVVAVMFCIIILSGWIYGLSMGGIQWHYLSRYLLLFIMGGFGFSLSNVGSYKALEYADAGIATIFSTLNTLAAIILSTLLIKEGLSGLQALGVAILLSSIWYIMSTNVKKSEKDNWLLCLMFSIFAAVCFGFAMTTEKYLLNHMSTPTYITIGWSFQGLAALSFSFIFNRNMWRKLFNKEVFKLVVGAGMLRVTAGFLLIFSLTLANNLSIISALAAVRIIFVVLLAAIFLNERKLFARKLVGALVAVAGIAVLLWK